MARLPSLLPGPYLADQLARETHAYISSNYNNNSSSVIVLTLAKRRTNLFSNAAEVQVAAPARGHKLLQLLWNIQLTEELVQTTRNSIPMINHKSHGVARWPYCHPTMALPQDAD